MKYMGSKRRIAKYIIPIIIENLSAEQYYVELFCGGCNLIDKINHPLKIANDVNTSLIALWKALQNGWLPPEYIDKEQYYDIWQNQDFYEPELVGYAQFCCSFSGKPFSGFAGYHEGQTIRNYQQEAKNNVLKQINKLQTTTFLSLSYDQVPIPDHSVIYCDPPYKNTTGYRVKFDHIKFWDYCRTKSTNHWVFISEYQAPVDFISIWEGKLKGTLSQNGMYNRAAKESTEKLFIHESKFDEFIKTIL